ncbi:hypothetical protein Tco_1290391, partial [Tanacetum coccineum]
MMMMNSKHHHASDSMVNVLFSPEYNPIMNYYSCGVQQGRCSNPIVKNLIEKAKNHLLAIGWTFFYVSKKTGTRELRYKAPTGRVYVSLRTSCECAIKNQDHLGSFDHMGGSKIDGFKKSKRKAESFFCVDRPEKKGRIKWGLSTMDPNYPNYFPNTQYYGGFQSLLNSQSPNLNPMPSTPNHETSQHVSRNLFEDSQIPSRSTEKNVKWETKEDIALMAAWCHVSGDSTRGNNQRKTSMWSRIWQMYEQTRAENPKEIGLRNENQMKAYSRMKSGMSIKDVELDAHKIYEGDGSKFLNLTVFNEVMCKNPKWMLNIDRDNTRSHRIDEEPNEESGGSTKRSRTSEEGEYVVHSNQETPNSGGSTIQRPIGRDVAKKKGK